MSRTVRLVCDRNSFRIHNIANQLAIENVQHFITGDMATAAIGGENLIQQICIVISENEVEKAKAILDRYNLLAEDDEV